MKCLSLHQPWATLIAIGAKRIETRGWSTSYRGPLAIHAAKFYSMQTAAFANSEPCASALREHGLSWEKLPRGAIIAVCNLVDCVVIRPGHEQVAEPEQSFGDFRAGRFMWLLADVCALPEPITFPGRQALFNVDLQLPPPGES